MSDKTNETKEERYNPYVFKLDVEGDIKEVKLDDGTVAKTMIPFVPYKDTVIVRGIFEYSAIGIVSTMDEHKLKQTGPISTVVVAAGPDVKHVDVGHEVAMPYNPGIQEIDIKDNLRSINRTKDYMSQPKNRASDTNFSKIKMVEYVIAPGYAIKGSFGKESK